MHVRMYIYLLFAAAIALLYMAVRSWRKTELSILLRLRRLLRHRKRLLLREIEDLQKELKIYESLRKD